MQKQARRREPAQVQNRDWTRLLWLATLATPLLLGGACEGLARLTTASRDANNVRCVDLHHNVEGQA